MIGTVLSSALLGLPTWMVVDGVWASLSRLADELPEGYSISAPLVLALSLGNMFPLVLTAVGSHLLEDRKSLTAIIYAILVTAGTVCVMLSLFWNVSVPLSPHTRASVPLYFLFFVAGSCASCSNVTHYVAVANHKPICTTSLSAGMATGSLCSGLLSILLYYTAPGSCVSIFFMLLAPFFAVGAFGFTMLNRLVTEAVPYVEQTKRASDDMSGTSSLIADDYDDVYGGGKADPLSFDYLKEDQNPQEVIERLLILLFLNGMMGYGIVPSVISTVCGRFLSRETVLLFATSLACVMDPIGRWTTAYVRFASLLHFYVATFFLLCIAITLVILAVIPREASPLFSHAAGGVVPASLYIFFVTCFGFANTCTYR